MRVTVEIEIGDGDREILAWATGGSMESRESCEAFLRGVVEVAMHAGAGARTRRGLHLLTQTLNAINVGRKAIIICQPGELT